MDIIPIDRRGDLDIILGMERKVKNLRDLRYNFATHPLESGTEESLGHTYVKETMNSPEGIDASQHLVHKQPVK